MACQRNAACREAARSWAAHLSVTCGLLVCLALTGRAQADLVNGGFEDPDTGPLPTARHIHQALIPAWETSASTGVIEIWSNGFAGVTAYEGKQHAELNADQASTLFQDVSGIDAGMRIGFEFAHRARQGIDVMSLTITDLGLDNSAGGGDDQVLFTKQYSAIASGWEFNTSLGEPPIVTLGNHVRFAYEAVSTGSGDPTRGNFIDAASFSVAVPEPSTALVLLGIAGLTVGYRRCRKNIAVCRPAPPTHL